MEFIYITNDPGIATYADESGIDRIMVDLESLGKEERQGNRDTVISGHSVEDVATLRNVLKHSKLQVRVNPLHKDSEREIDEVIDRGAQVVMLPMFKSGWEVKEFVAMVGSRALTCLLLETAQALVRVDDILAVDGVNEVYIGLNDLHLMLDVDFMFELLSGGIVEYLANKIERSGVPFGFGGIARLGTGVVDAGLILSEHVRLGSSIVILSRAFHGGATSVDELKKTVDLETEVSRMRRHLAYLSGLPRAELEANGEQLARMVTAHIEPSMREARRKRQPAERKRTAP